MRGSFFRAKLILNMKTFHQSLSYNVYDVFTPSQPAKLAFVDRANINDSLVNALNTPGKQIVVYGHSGSGKTTLLTNKLYQVYEGHITSRCMKGMTFDQIMIDAFDQLESFYTSDKVSKLGEIIKTSLTGTYIGIKAALEASLTSETSRNEKRILPPQLTPQSLGRLLGASNQCWVIEDFHKVDQSEKQKLSQLLKVFMDLAVEYRNLKIICLGAVDTARQVVDYDEEMKERLSEIHVPLMNDDEINSIISKGEVLLKIRIPLPTRRKIINHACGVASICHQICLNMCINGNICEKNESEVTLTEENFDNAVKMYINDASDTLKGAFDKALKIRKKTKFDSSKLIIKALAHAPERGLARLKVLSRIQEETSNYTDSILKPHINKLIEAEYGAILRIDSDSGLYSFKDPFYRAYAQTILYNEDITNLDNGNQKSRIIKLIFNIMHEGSTTIELEEKPH